MPCPRRSGRSTWGGIDTVVGIGKAWNEAVREGVAEVTLSTGQVVQAPTHPQFLSVAQRRLVGRTVDLRRAFKQLAIGAEFSSLAVVCIWHPGWRRPAFYVLRALPFGTRNAVFVFGAVARAIDIILVGELNI